MAWRRVENYWLGYSLTTKQFYFYYKLVDESLVYQIFPATQEYLALADMFRNEGPISFNTEGQYFTSAPEEVGEQEGHGEVVSDTEFVNLAQYVTYGSGRSVEVRKANRTGYKTAYDLANNSGRSLYQNAGDLEIEIDQTGDSVGSDENEYWIGVRIDGDVNIVGAGITRTRIKFFPDTPTFNSYAFYQDAGRNNSISDCTITGPLNGSDQPNPLFYGIKHQGDADAAVISDETLTLRNVKIDGEFTSAVESNEGDLICTLDGCDISAYVKAVGYHVVRDTHKQLIVRNCYFHHTGTALNNSALLYVSPGASVDISHSRFAHSLRFGVYLWTEAGVAVEPLYSRITNNVFEETLVNAILVSGKSRPLIQGNLIKTRLVGVDFYGSHRGAEVLDNEVIQPADPLPNWTFISGGVSWESGAHVKVQGNTVSAGEFEDSGPTAAIRLGGEGVVWDVAGNHVRLHRPNLSGINGSADNLLAFVHSNKFTGTASEACMSFNGGTIYASDNIFEPASGTAFDFRADTLVNAFLDDNEVSASLIPLYISLSSESAGKIRGSGNNFASALRPEINWMKDFKYQMITPKTGVCPTALASAGDTLLPLNYDTVHISGNAAINNFFYHNADATKLFCGEVRVIFDDEGATTTGEGNIQPQTTDERVVGKVYRFMHDPRTGWWYE